jgi:hypothetical protein
LALPSKSIKSCHSFAVSWSYFCPFPIEKYSYGFSHPNVQRDSQYRAPNDAAATIAQNHSCDNRGVFKCGFFDNFLTKRPRTKLQDYAIWYAQNLF